MGRPRALVFGIFLVLASCGGGNAASNLANAPQYQPKGGDSKCGVTKSQAKPLIVEWSPSDRGQLEARVHHGLVAVHYDRCEMEVLERCRLPGSYTYQGVTRSHDSVVMRDADDLYANVPLGAAKLESTLNRAGSLKVSMTIVGRYEADIDEIKASDLTGACARATHVVTAVTTGAFSFFAEGQAKVGGGVGTTVGNAGAHASSESTREMITDDGDEESCKKGTSADKTPPEGCGALIRIEVEAIGVAGPPSAAPVVRAGGTVGPETLQLRNDLAKAMDEIAGLRQGIARMAHALTCGQRDPAMVSRFRAEIAGNEKEISEQSRSVAQLQGELTSVPAGGEVGELAEKQSRLGELRLQIRRTHTRLALLSDTVLSSDSAPCP